VPTTVNQQSLKAVVDSLLLLIPPLLIVVVLIYLVLSYTRGTGLFGIRSGARRDPGRGAIGFEDVAGVDEAIDELAEVRDYLSDPERFARLGARIPQGYLLVGPPGCGKTLLARALAGESGASFFSISGSDFTELYVGVGASRVRDLFREAREHSPAIIFIDEIDAIGAERGAAADGHREREQTLNQILIELDGFDQREGVIAMAATNRGDILDPALVRPGRFDRAITLPLPDRGARSRILEVHSRDKQLSADVDLDIIARLTQGFSGADLANVLNEATLLAARRERDSIDLALVEEGIDRVRLGISRSQLLSDEERRTVAYHEAGHALAAMSLPGAVPLHKVSIVSRGRSLGQSHWIGEGEDEALFSRSKLLDRMATLLAGRVAEEQVFGEPGSGAADDLANASELARRMVRDWGMSEKLGPLVPERDGRDASGVYSEETARLIDSEVRALLAEAEDRARAVLKKQRKGLDLTAEALLEQETLSLDEVEELVGVRAAS
jgi:cell division protease FtsH